MSVQAPGSKAREFDGNPALPAVVFAAPGSGKTRRIVSYAVHLLESGVPGNHVVLATFTREAGEQLRSRLLARTHGTALAAEAKRVAAGTVDSYALALLHRLDTASRAWSLLGDTGPAAIVRYLAGRRAFDLWSLFPPVPGAPPQGTGDRVKRFLEHVQYAYNESRSVAALRKSNAALAAALEAYWAELERRRRHDFGTVVAAVHRCLDARPDALAEENERYFLVDEGQDLNTNQLLLVERLAGPGRRLLVVGDDDQQMYAWRGSNPRNLRAALDRLGATPYTLPTNHRSTDRIIGPALRLILHNGERRFPKLVRGRGVPGEDGDVGVRLLPDLEAEYRHVVDSIRGTVGRQYVRPAEVGEGDRASEIRFRDVLVLVRSRSAEALGLIRRLREAGIPVDATNVLNVRKHPFGKLLVNGLRYVVYNPEGGKWQPGLRTTRSIVTQLRGLGLAEPAVRRFLVRLEHFKAAFLDESAKHPKQSWEFAQKVFHAYVRSVVLKGWPEPLDDEMELIVGVLSTAVRDWEDITPRIGGGGLYWLVQMLHDGDGLPTKSPGAQAPDAVRVFTVHNAKGLEADVVILPFSTEGAYPMLRTQDPAAWQWNRRLDPPYDEGVAEERNLFYVALTRARRYLFVSHQDGQTPSPFIAEAGLAKLVATPRPRALMLVADAPTPRELVSTMSDLGVAYDCRYRYRLAKGAGIHPGANTQIGYGSSIHLINQVNLDSFRDHGVPVPRGQYEAEIDRLTHLPYAFGSVADSLRQGVRERSLSLWDKWSSVGPQVVDTEVEFTLQLNNVTIVEGRSDALLRLERGGPVWNIDLKTEAIAAREARGDAPGQEWPVLTQQIYQLGLAEVGRSAYGVAVGGSQLYFAAIDRHVVVPTSPADLRAAQKAVEAVAEDIQHGRLRPNPSEPRCAACDYKLVCRHAPAAVLEGVGQPLRKLL